MFRIWNSWVTAEATMHKKPGTYRLLASDLTLHPNALMLHLRVSGSRFLLQLLYFKGSCIKGSCKGCYKVS